MRKETTTRTLYQFDELPTEKAKDKARDWFREGMFNYGWWDHIYEDAKNIGLEITSFDDYNISGELKVSVTECCSRIIANHGKLCTTYRLAEWFFKNKADNKGKPYFLEDFKREILGLYKIMLKEEIEYMESNESVDENIRANEYEFTEDGKRA
jgi:hypothetical protein